MSYSQVNIDKFKGLNSQVAPELIEDGQARDILNFRMEKVGKLVSRDGYIIGLELPQNHVGLDGLLATHSDGVRIESYNTFTHSFVVNKGLIGISELILDDKNTMFDTDRLMVYVIRGTERIGQTQRDAELYLFTPLSGQYKNNILYDVGVSNYICSKPQAYNLEGDSTELKAPNRFIPSKDDPDTYDDTNDNHWIEHYLKMTQYRHRLIISDRINGDTAIEDEFNRSEEIDRASREHLLRLAPNCLEEFDIDVVELDNRMLGEQENDATAGSDGVVNGMALYNYKLPKKYTKVTQDHFENKLSNPEWIIDTDDGDDAKDRVIPYLSKMELDNFLSIINFHPSTGYQRIDTSSAFGRMFDIHHNEDNRYIFTNEKEVVEFDDLTGKLEFLSDEYKNEDGETVKDNAADVYIWDDVKLPYYVSSGVNLATDNLMRYLSDIDRKFQKLGLGVRLFKLKSQKGAAKNVPLGIWKYRFVWDFGNGVYSAPSAEILCPDIMWSAMRDSDIYEDDISKYERFRDYNKEYDAFPSNVNDSFQTTFKHELYGQFVQQIPPYVDNETDMNAFCPQIKYPKLFDDSMNLTTLGEKVFAVKHELYKGLEHKFGTKDALTVAELNAWTADLGGPAYKKKGEFGVLVTTKFANGNNVELEGFAWEGIAIAHSTYTWGTVDWLTEAYWDDEGDEKIVRPLQTIPTTETNVIRQRGKIIVPIFQTFQPMSYNSIFDNEGRLRYAYKNMNESNATYQIIVPGLNAGFGQAAFTSTPNIESILFIDYGVCGIKSPDIYFNIVAPPFADPNGSINLDLNNNPTDDFSIENRPQTMIRNPKKEEERLIWTNDKVPFQAKDRLILSGRMELELCKFDDKVYFDSEYDTTYFSVFQLIRNATIQSDEDTNGRGAQRAIGGITVPNGATPVTYDYADNLDITIYGEGERFIGIEQLTSYFPSSLLFNAPRMGIKIHDDYVPKRAKRLLVFRTKCSHANDYQPSEYGLVKAIDLKSDNDTLTVVQKADTAFTTEDYVDNEGQTQDFHGIYFFDDVKDSDIDFGETPNYYEGVRNALKSRFNIALNERLYYLNFMERWRAIAPRKYLHLLPLEPAEEMAFGSYIYDTNFKIVATGTEKGYTSNQYVQYLYCYIDGQGIKSETKETSNFLVYGGSPTAPVAVVLFFMPSTFDTYIDRVKVYRRKNTALPSGEEDYTFIGDVLPEDEGIFVDDNLPSKGKYIDNGASIENYESGIRWSEPYRPDWMKLESFYEARAGDGKQITGAESLYGNLVIFKETSMHRAAVQASEIPISRVDEITNEIGCIAPNTLININNTLYFLSWKGFMKYDNNVLQKIDGLFDEELQFVLKSVPEEYVRDASCGYNPHYNEIYLNIPMLPTLTKTNSEYELVRQFEYGKGLMYQSNESDTEPTYFQRSLLGHIYVINLDKQYATKFAYQPTVYDPVTQSPPGTYLNSLKEVVDQRQLIRLYYTNSFGELRTGDIFPCRYFAENNKVPGEDLTSPLLAGIYIETPYQRSVDEPLLKDTDEIVDGALLKSTQGVFYDEYDPGVPNYPILSWRFPPKTPVPIQSRYKSKFFTGETESMIKRVRKVLFNLFSRGAIRIKSIAIPESGESGIVADDRIENVNEYPFTDQQFDFSPSISTKHPLTGIVATGTGSNILSVIPQSPNIELGGVPQDKWNDWYGKPIRYSVEIESELRTQINYITIHWRPIHTYLH